MLILFEGPDGSGKTTLIKQLTSKHLQNALVCKRNSFKTYSEETSNYPVNIDLTQSALYDWRFFLEMHAANFASHMFLCDRSFITQVVYQNATGPETKFDALDKTLEAYEKEVKNLPHLVVFCKRSTLRNDNDVHFINGKEDDIVKEYFNYMQNTSLNTIHLDTEKLTVDASVALVLGAIQAAYNLYVNESKDKLTIWT
jgi:thymidylate kinase